MLFISHTTRGTPDTLYPTDNKRHVVRLISTKHTRRHEAYRGRLVASKITRRMITKCQSYTHSLSRAKKRRSPTHAPEGTAAPACSETELLCHAQLSADWPRRGSSDSSSSLLPIGCWAWLRPPSRPLIGRTSYGNK